MKQRLNIKNFFWAVLLFFVVAVGFSCSSKDDSPVSPLKVRNYKVVITAEPQNYQGEYTFQVGLNSSYEKFRDGKKVADEGDFSYESEESKGLRGKYTTTLETRNIGGLTGTWKINADEGTIFKVIVEIYADGTKVVDRVKTPTLESIGASDVFSHIPPLDKVLK